VIARRAPKLLAFLTVATLGASWLSAGTGFSATRAPGCASVPRPRSATRTASKPTRRLPSSKTYYVTLWTNCGNFTVKVDPRSSPNAAASFVRLAQRGFYKKTAIFQIKRGAFFVGGDPTGTGRGGPGYTTFDRVPSGSTYPYGAVVMERPATTPAGTAGSQFLVVTAKDANLSPVYAVVGSVHVGTGVIDRIALHGNSQQKPSIPIVVEKATVSTQ
jgi:peptidyl-prolyl cis-trans isomerase B (cyclophilin B)